MGKSVQVLPTQAVVPDRYVCLEVGSLICALAPGQTALIVGRAVAGLGGSGVAIGVFTMLGFTAFPECDPSFSDSPKLPIGLLQCWVRLLVEPSQIKPQPLFLVAHR
jgi:hypothetical protein